MRRFAKALSFALAMSLVVATVAMAAYEFQFPTMAQDTSGNARTYYPVLLGYNGQAFVDSGKIAATGLDTNMQVGTTDVEYTITTTQVAAVVPSLPASGMVTVDFYTGYTPNQTNLSVLVGDNGRFETADNAAVELGQNFEIEFDGYVDTSKVHYPLVYKPGAILVDISAAGTITAGCINADSYDVTPGVFAAWTDVDVSAYVPDGASGVVVEIDTANNTKQIGLRKNGSTDDRKMVTEHFWAMIGLDDSEIFEVYLDDNTCHVYLRAYTDDNWVYNTDADDVSLAGALAWTDVDLTAYTEDGAIAAIIEVVNTDGVNGRENGVRKNGSTDNRHPDLMADNHTFRVVGLDDSEIFEGYIETLDVDYYLIGYCRGGGTFATNATDKSLGASLAWTDVDCSSEAPDSTYLFFEVLYSSNDGVGFRENGCTDNIVTDVTEQQVQGIVKADINQVCEAYEEDHTVTALYLVGHTEYGVYPAFPSPTYLVSSSVGGGALASGVKNIKVTGTGGGGNLVLDVDGATDSNAIGAGVTNTTDNWRFMSRAIPYLTDYYHTVGGVLQITYEPDNMLTASTVEDETNAFDGTIAWGDNQNMAIAYGEMSGSGSSDASADEAGGFDMPASGLPSTWFAAGEGMSGLPYYDMVLSVSNQTGQPVQVIYFIIILAFAFGVLFLLTINTRAAILGVVGFNIVLFVGSSMTIVPMWIPFAVMIIQVGMLYLYRQVAY